MWRLFKHYNISSSYDGIMEVADASKCDLDECKEAGQINLMALLEIITKREWLWAAYVRALNDLDFFRSLMNLVPLPLEQQITAKKWKKHLRDMEGFGILKRKARSCIKSFARYFAVMKSDGLTARSMFNGKHLSRCFKSPPTTNLPDIADVLKIIAMSDFLIIGDFRHYFHQFPLNEEIGGHFGLEQSDEAWIYTVLPMGWSWSPRIAQSSSMSILLEASVRSWLMDLTAYKESPNPPSIIHFKKGSNGEVVGSAIVWYDNVLACFTDAQSRDLYDEKLDALTSDRELNVSWKEFKKWSRKDMAESRPEKDLPHYLGLVFANGRGKRARDTDETPKIK